MQRIPDRGYNNQHMHAFMWVEQQLFTIKIITLTISNTVCRSCIIKHVKVSEKCPTCESEIRLGNLRYDIMLLEYCKLIILRIHSNRPDIRLRSIVYKIIPGLYAKERQRRINEDSTRIFLKDISGVQSLVTKQIYDEDDVVSTKQYFYDPEEPIR